MGRFQRVVVLDVCDTRKPVPNHGCLVQVNPEITHWEGFELGRDGCLAVSLLHRLGYRGQPFWPTGL